MKLRKLLLHALLFSTILVFAQFTATARTSLQATATAAATGTVQAPNLKVQYMTDRSNATADQLDPFLKVVNIGNVAVPLSQLTMHYYFTKDNTSTLVTTCDWAKLGCANIVRSLHPYAGQNADSYLEVGFTAAAGNLAPGANTGDIQMRVNRTNWTNMNQANDYSFDGSKTSFADWTKVTLYLNGVLIWGTEPTPLPTATAPATVPATLPATEPATLTATAPATEPATTTATPEAPNLKVQYMTDRSNATADQLDPFLKVVNIGNVAVPLSQLTMHYYFTKDNTSTLVTTCDWAKLGCANIVRSLHPYAGQNADSYLEVGFTAAAGNLAPGANTGDIQMRVNRTNWTNMNQANDYSFDGTKTSFADWTKVTLYLNGVLIWGTEPTPVTATAATSQATAPQFQP